MSRYDRDPGALLDQAREEIRGCEVAEDGLILDVPLKG
jgi:hypothetical protein